MIILYNTHTTTQLNSGGTKDHFGQVKVPGTDPYYSTTNVSNKVKAGKLLKV